MGNEQDRTTLSACASLDRCWGIVVALRYGGFICFLVKGLVAFEHESSEATQLPGESNPFTFPFLLLCLSAWHSELLQ
uniref:Uncharacterized protein n=1 Tax=Rhizophora mucronata TaxID=61149 RepID=A0A2P2PIE9_RHIMU